MPHARNRFLTSLLATAALLPMTLLASCGMFHSAPGGELTARSSLGERSLTPSFTTAAYVPLDENTAEIYLSDIPADRFLDERDRLADAKGSIVHLHVFLMPSAGDTPIDSTACNATVRHLILAGPGGGTGLPLMGLYAGGGFMYPSGDIGDADFGGSLSGASHRLSRSTPGFNDPLGSGELSGKLDAQHNEHLARAMASKLEMLVHRLPPPVETPVADPSATGKPAAPPATPTDTPRDEKDVPVPSKAAPAPSSAPPPPDPAK